MAAPTEPLTAGRRVEAAACATDPLYFLDRFGQVYDALAKEWLPFRVWPAQAPVLEALDREQLLVVLKARQLGLTWLALGYVLWLMTFWPAATVLLFSKREEESVYLLGEERLRGMWRRLPGWLRPPAGKPDGATAWALQNGSVARAFPANAGDSYTATLALVDEADLVPDLDTLLGRVKPTIDAGGKLLLLSRADKSRPESPFKRVYRAARAGENAWHPLFLPWHAHPGRDAAWYEAQRRDVLARTGSLDDLFEQYPATEAEALSPRTLDKRIAPAWLSACYVPQAPLWPLPPGAPSLPGLEVYRVPRPGRGYLAGMDPAEGNPQSDDSALSVVDAATGEECAALAGRHEPAVFAAHGAALARWYNSAGLLVERNNHGHAVLLWLRENAGLWLLCGHDGREGWLSSAKGKAVLYDAAADAFRDGETVLHSLATFTQLSAVGGSTLRAPEGQKDDRAVAHALALWAARQFPEFTRGSIGTGGNRLGAAPPGVFGTARGGGRPGKAPPGVFRS